MKKYTQLLLLIFILSQSVFGQKITNENIQTELKKMSLSTEKSPEILFVSDVIDGFVSVLIKPSYRDFPNIVVFKLDSLKQSWIRPYETFCIGIQDERSEFTDLHTKGFAIDFNIGKDTVVVFDDKTKRIIDAMSSKNRGVVIPYQNFFHSCFTASKVEGYTIDKTQYRDFALMLGLSQYSRYPSDNCMMFDTPKIQSIEFNKKGDMFYLTGHTINRQKWIISFTGLTDDLKYFKSKIISVSNE